MTELNTMLSANDLNSAQRLDLTSLVSIDSQNQKTLHTTLSAFAALIVSASAHFVLMMLHGTLTIDNPLWREKAELGICVGAILSFVFLFRNRTTVPQNFAIASMAQLAGWLMTTVLFIPVEMKTTPATMAVWACSLPLVVLLLFSAFDRMREVAEVLFGVKPIRLISPAGARDPNYTPKVSIHVPACGEPVDMLTVTLKSMAELDYPNFEVLVIVNNTSNMALVDPIRDVCEALGDRFKFIYLPKISGFKAGALNRALEYTADDAEIIASVDADYVVDPDWLKDLVPAFKDPKVAVVQAPQEHRDEDESWRKAAMNAEYAGFFDIGMIQRNEDDAIIAHGTMVMLRRSAMHEVGDWSEWSITEDSELGLRLFEAGYSAVYTHRRYGWGLLPDTLRAFRRQRDRWAAGGMQIMLRHFKHMMPWSKTLTGIQKYHFMTGWLHWIADAASMLLVLVNLGWVAYLQVTGLYVAPTPLLTITTSTVAIISLLQFMAFYAARTKRGGRHALLASLAGISLQLTVAKAIFRGLIWSNMPFNVTAKGGKATPTGYKLFLETFGMEAVLSMVLLSAAALIWSQNELDIVELNNFAAMLIMQALPFTIAFGMGVNEFVENASLAKKQVA